MLEKQIGQFYVSLTDGKHPSIVIEFQIEPNFYAVCKSVSYADRKLALDHYENDLTHERIVRQYLINRQQYVKFGPGKALTVEAKEVTRK